MFSAPVPLRIKIPPKEAIAEVVGYLKGKRAMAGARQVSGRKRHVKGEQFWARGDAVSTVGFEEQAGRQYRRHQEQLDTKGDDDDTSETPDPDQHQDGKF
jgi:putative transposase